jgi:hypothetical protein
MTSHTDFQTWSPGHTVMIWSFECPQIFASYNSSKNLASPWRFLKMGISVQLLLNFSSTLAWEQDDGFFSSLILYGMSTTLPQELKTFLQDCTISGESTQHFLNFWTRCNNCSKRNLQMHMTYYNVFINIGSKSK